jgi:hypothetical protein
MRGSEVTLRITVDGETQDGSWFKVKDFSINEDGEIADLDYLGEVTSDHDYQHHGYSFSFSLDVQDRKVISFLNKIVERETLRLQHPVITMTVFYAFRDGTATVETYQNVVMRPTGTNFGSRKDGVTSAFEGKCSRRNESQQ